MVKKHTKLFKHHHIILIHQLEAKSFGAVLEWIIYNSHKNILMNTN